MNRKIERVVLCLLILSANARSDPGDSLKVRSATRDDLPHVLRHDHIEKSFYPHLFGTLGISTYAPNFDGLQPTLRQKEDDYRRQGFTISNGRMSVTTSPLCWASIGLDFDQTIRATLEGGWNFEEESRIYAGSLGLFYMPQLLHARTFQGFVGTGIVAFHAFVRARYNVALKYGTLEAIEMTSEKIGGFVRGGVEWEMARELSVSIDATYYLVSPATTGYSPGSLNFSSLSAGLRILFHFTGGSTP